MDNVTHTLIGIAAAETLISLKPPRTDQRVKLWVTSALANNLPDFDVVYTWGGDRLTYLLHHRGHSHTLLLAPLQGLILLAALFLFWRRDTASPWRAISCLALLGPLLHLFADSWNTYGVHPFWPLDNRWYYGDLVFIIEPWLWVAFLPLVWKRSASLAAKTLCLGLLAFVVGVSWHQPFVQPLAALGVTLGGTFWLWAQRQIASQRRRVAGALAICGVVFGLFGAAQARVRANFQVNDQEVVVQLHPANPLCATVFTAGFDGDYYRATLWTASALPELVPASACRRFAAPETSAGLHEISGVVPSRAREPVGEFVSTRGELDRLAATCRGHAFLRFSRVPFWFQERGQSYLGDLRFDRDRELGFAELPVDGECPRNVPPWRGRFLPSAG